MNYSRMGYRVPDHDSRFFGWGFGLPFLGGVLGGALGGALFRPRPIYYRPPFYGYGYGYPGYYAPPYPYPYY